MKKLLLLTLLSAAFGASLFAQTLSPAGSSTGSITTNGANCNTTNACIVLHLASSNVGYSVTASGTWTGTLTVEQSGDNQGSWSSVTTTTANTLFTSALTPGITDVRVRGSAAMTGAAVITITASGPATLQVNAGGSSSSASSTGPVINVTNSIYAGGASSSSADNLAQFTAAFAAANAVPIAGTGTVTFKAVASAAPCAACTTYQMNISGAAGDTVLVHAIGTPAGRTITVTDSGGNYYSRLYSQISSGSSVDVFASNPGAIVNAFSSVTVTISGANAAIGGIATSFGNVGSYRTALAANGSGTVPAQADNTGVANSMFVSGFAWFNSATIAASQNTGTLQATFTATATVPGGAVVTQSSASPATLTNNITIGSTSTWAASGVELVGQSLVAPTVYIPYGSYSYSGGISMTRPATLKCEPGTRLNYIGVAHAVDVGTAGLTATTNSRPYYIEGCTWTGGTNMTQGIFINSFVTLVGFRWNNYYNFGNSTAFMIFANDNNWDVEVGPQERFITDDYQPRNILRMNGSGINNSNSYLRMHDDLAVCWEGFSPGNTGGCIATHAGTGVVVDGAASRIYHNNLAFFNPVILMRCSATNCFGTNITDNELEGPGAAGGTPVPPIQFQSTQDGTIVSHNTFNVHSLYSPMGPFDGSSLLTGLRFNFNTITNIPLATAVVAMNNTAGQTGNQSWGNECSVAFAAKFPCALMHTVGGNITQWNTDYYGACTMNGSTGCPAVTFSQTYGVAPKCTATWNGAGTLTGILKAAVTTTTLTITSSVAGDTAGINYSCSSADGQ